MKKFSPESNVSAHIIGICILLMVVLGIVICYFNSVRKDIEKQSRENEQYIELVRISEDFISEALESQQLFNEYVYSWKDDYVARYRESVSRMDSIIALAQRLPQLKSEYEIFLQVTELLDEQYQLGPKLRKRLYAENPVDKVAQDSLFTKDLDLAVGRASLSYDINIRSLRHEIVHVISLNNDISEKISKLLLAIFENSSQRTVKLMENALQVARTNNRYSLLIGLSTVVLIIVLSLVILLNVYRIRKSTKELQKANRDKVEVMSSRHRLLLSVAHDIKTPMNSIKAYLSASDISIEERRIMMDSTSHVLALMDNLVDFSTMQCGQIFVNRGNFNLQDLCDRSVDMFNSLAREKGLELSREYRNDCDIRVNSDGLKIRQILINLISNAFKYTIKGSVKVSVACLPDRSADGYLLEVMIIDTGVGISEDQMQNIFKPYFRSEDNRHLSNGTGLGLYVVDGFTKLLNGEIHLESVLGKGTRVFLRLPLDRYVPNFSSDASKRILVIEDDPVFRTVVKMLLSRLSHEVIASSTLVQGDFDFVLSDLNLPDITPAAVMEAYRGIPVVLMTGDTSYSLQEAQDMGFLTVLYKPFSMEDMKEVFGGIPLENDSIVMLGDDTAQMNSVVETFMESVPSYLKGLTDSLENDDILAARFVSHKMLPMFVMFRSGAMIPILNRLNAVGNEGVRDYPNWRADVESLIRMIRQQYS